MDESTRAQLDRLERQLTRVEDLLAKLLPTGGDLDHSTPLPPSPVALASLPSAFPPAPPLSEPPTSSRITEASLAATALAPFLPAEGLEPPPSHSAASELNHETPPTVTVDMNTNEPVEGPEEEPVEEPGPDSMAVIDDEVADTVAQRHVATIATPAPDVRQTSIASAPLPSRPSAPDAIDWSRLENLIAGRWYALLGALVVTIGVALFVQFAVKQGWLAQLSVSARCMLGAALGFVLIGAGEWARRKLNDWASVGLTAGGLGAVYVSAYAAYALYKLLDPGTALLLLAGVAGLGIAISALTSLSAVAIVSLTGAYLAPIIASSGREGHVYVPAYWIALLIVGLVLSVRKGGNFAFCRGLTSLATLGFGFAWCMEFAKDSPWIGSSFLAAAWLAVHAELWYTAARADRANLPEPYERDLNELEHAEPLHIFQSMRLRSLATLSYSGWAVLLGLHLATESGAMLRSAAPGVGCAATLVLAGLIVGTHRVLNLRPVSRREILAATLMCIAGTLLIATIAIAFSGFALALTLCAVGLGALAASRLLRARVLDLYGMLVLAFATLRIVLFDS